MRIHPAKYLFLTTVLLLSNIVLSQTQSPQPQPTPTAQEKKCQGLGCPIPGDEIPPAATPTPTPPRVDGSKGVTFRKVFTNLPADQETIWTSPFHIHATDAYWLVPLAATSGVLIGSDAHSMARA
jgi:hypothetical protein